MGPTVTIRPGTSRPIAAAVVACCAIAVVLVGTTGSGAVMTLRWAGPASLVAIGAWITYWRPEVEVSDGGVRIVNPWRTIHVPWPALDDVDRRWSLAVSTVDGRRFSAFAAPAPGITERGSSGVSGRAAEEVGARREALRKAGYLDEVRLEGAPVRVVVPRTPLVASGCAAVVTVLAWTLPG